MLLEDILAKSVVLPFRAKTKIISTVKSRSSCELDGFIISVKLVVFTGRNGQDRRICRQLFASSLKIDFHVSTPILVRQYVYMVSSSGKQSGVGRLAQIHVLDVATSVYRRM